ncbi:MAG: hypothetical protein M2R45_04487 [Verrucomicrobia subdivision 3 bacterium]|nr:hypothetical protein [Limisphaerales bacterium]MCS1412669.1 hypothetical protein [Limisphaerales bacterium]
MARAQWSYDAGHLPCAVCLPFSFLTTEAFHVFAQQYAAGHTLVLYCGDADCEQPKCLPVKLRDEFWPRKPVTIRGQGIRTIFSDGSKMRHFGRKCDVLARN